MIVDEHTVGLGRYFRAGYLGPVASSFTLAWLATHRGRLRTFLFGLKRLTITVSWDTGGGRSLDHDEAEIEALRRIVYGPKKTNQKRGAR